MAALSGFRIAFLTANEGVEAVELTAPWDAARTEDAVTLLIAPQAGAVQLMEHLEMGQQLEADLALGEARAEDFDALVLPGGVANPDQLRTDPRAIAFVQALAQAGKPIAVICHGPWTLVEADLVKGRALTSWPSIATDIRNAGGTWIDEQVVECVNGPNTIISSRSPEDLPAFIKSFVEVFSEFSERAGISHRSDDEIVDEAGMESFPTSDAPSFTPR